MECPTWPSQKQWQQAPPDLNAFSYTRSGLFDWLHGQLPDMAFARRCSCPMTRFLGFVPIVANAHSVFARFCELNSPDITSTRPSGPATPFETSASPAQSLSPSSQTPRKDDQHDLGSSPCMQGKSGLKRWCQAVGAGTNEMLPSSSTAPATVALVSSKAFTAISESDNRWHLLQ